MFKAKRKRKKKTGSCAECVSSNDVCVRLCNISCMCRESSGIALRPVGNADSIGGGLGLAEQMVCVIGAYQLQGHR